MIFGGWVIQLHHALVPVYFVMAWLWTAFLFLVKKHVKLAYFISQLHNKLFTICLHSNIAAHVHYVLDFLQPDPMMGTVK